MMVVACVMPVAAALGATTASAAVNEEVGCWHMKGRADYKPDQNLRRQLEVGRA
jgi:hypothetical protein